ncbi:peptidoglycan-binding domain-containing protein [Cellulomonas sp. URHE0023]|uniref:peptidoglycan-binding domain-containing protein n=1 Tax=Cellulomonas sp. URHE0023 TaxID=1380354 RepID=UPI000550C9AE|nr:peptidoglycan-binding domain-containing protein [Cellulomonas sp. URHE0023]
MSSPLSTGRRTIVAMAVVAVVCLGAGLLLSRLLTSPGKAAADAAPPVAGPITVPVENRVIANTVVIRGDVGYDDPVTLRVETGDLGGPAVVTGQVPAVDAILQPASVALEVVGRPVIVLPGDLPTYRTLRAGVSGPDVVQLKAALASLGIDAGASTDTYDAATAAGVRALYQRVGYEPPTAGEDLTAAAESAQDEVRSAKSALAAAQRALAAAGTGQARSALIGLDTAVAVARQTLATEQARCASPAPAPAPSPSSEGGSPAPEQGEPCSPVAVTQAQGALDQALAARQEADAAPQTAAERDAVASAQLQLSTAQKRQTEAESATITPLPASEVVFVPTLPRRVDSVDVQRGGTVSGNFMSVSGATIQVVGVVSREDTELLPVGTTGTVSVDDTDLTVTVTEVRDPKPKTPADPAAPADPAKDDAAAPGDRKEVVFTLPALTAEQAASLQDSNVRVRVPVSSTNGEVLAVPLAALTAGPGGESRLELAGKAGASTLVTVTTGLAADGFVEIAKAEKPLAAGDLVVVGTAKKDEPDPKATAKDSKAKG